MAHIVCSYPDVTAWITDRAGCGGELDPSVINSIALVEDKDAWPRVVCGGCVYTDYTGDGGSVAMHVAGARPGWMTRDFLWAAFDYPFNQLGVRRVIGSVPSDNLRALNMDLKLGFVPEAVIRGVYPDADAIILVLERDRCRWLKYRPKHHVSGARLPQPVKAE